MEVQDILKLLVEKYPLALLVFSALGTLVILGQVVVGLTPSKKDDEAWEKIKAIPVLGAVISAIASFGVIQKK